MSCTGIPLPVVQCGPLVPRKHPRVEVGSPKGAMAFRLRERIGCKCLPYKDTSAIDMHEAEKQREIEHLIKIMDFVEQSDRKIHRKNIRNHIQQGLAAYEETVNVRRQKLREVLLKEQMGLIREVVNQAQHGDDARMEEMRKKMEELQREQEEQRLAIVNEKKMLQFLEECPDIREKLVKKRAKEAKEGNVAQMMENEARKLEKQEIENMWHDLMLKDVATKKEREIEEARQRAVCDQNLVTTLQKQMAGKLALEEQKRKIDEEDREYVACLIEQLKKDEAERLENERRKRDALRKDLEEQVRAEKKRLAERARREEEMDRMRDSLVAKEIARERAKMKESSMALRKELLAYIQYLNDIRKQEEIRSTEIDRIIEKATMEAHAKRDQAVKQYNEAKKKGLQDVLEGLEEQLRIKREKEKQEEEKRRMETEEMQRVIETDAKLAVLAMEEEKKKRLKYKQDLEDQVKMVEHNRKMEAEEEERWYQDEIKRREECLKLAEELLKVADDITPHPFKVLLKKQCEGKKDDCPC